VTIYTDLTGRIREASEQACELLGVAASHLAVTRKLPLFFVENRHQLLELMSAAAGGLTMMQMPTIIQGLRGGRRRVLVEIHRIGSVHQDLLEWVLVPVDRPTPESC
jgi:PAS domain-containing protein